MTLAPIAMEFLLLLNTNATLGNSEVSHLTRRRSDWLLEGTRVQKVIQEQRNPVSPLVDL